MAKKLKLLDVVTILEDMPAENLRRGQVGTIVDTLAQGKAFEVEFADRQGRTYKSLGLRSEQLMLLRFEPPRTRRARVATAVAR